MDRLLCGDVGYGKTEVAFRAIMKCVLDGKQAAILVPTTVLARQHFLTAKQPLCQVPGGDRRGQPLPHPGPDEGHPAAAWSRGASTCSSAPTGSSRRTCSSRTWACWSWTRSSASASSHKEKLKELSKQVDVLTLSATPIPRTLNMALSGIRDMSTLEEPPHGPPAGADLCAGARLGGAGRRHAPGAGAGRPGVLPPQPGGDHRPAPPPASRRCWGRTWRWRWPTAR